jgi:hypothetical protein
VQQFDERQVELLARAYHALVVLLTISANLRDTYRFMFDKCRPSLFFVVQWAHLL